MIDFLLLRLGDLPIAIGTRAQKAIARSPLRITANFFCFVNDNARRTRNEHPSLTSLRTEARACAWGWSNPLVVMRRTCHMQTTAAIGGFFARAKSPSHVHRSE